MQFCNKKVLGDYIRSNALQHCDHPAILCHNKVITYTELKDKANKLGVALLGAGIKRGDRIAVLGSPSLEYWISFLAATSIGATWLGLNPKYKLPELRYVLEDAQPKLLFATAEFEGYSYADSIAALQQDYGFIEQVISLAETLPNTLPLNDFLALADAVDDQALYAAQQAVESTDPALLVYTSGSTGQPKGALLSHHSLCFGAWVQAQHYGLDRPKMLCNFPINHVACVADICCVNLVAGGTLVFQERFDPAQVLTAIHDQQINLILAVPTMLLMLLEHSQFRQTDFSGMAMIAWGVAALPVPIIKRLQKLVPRLMNV